MPQPVLRHIARRAVQVAITAAGILVILLVFSRQAHAATAPPATAATTSPGSGPVASATGSVTSVLGCSARDGTVCVLRPPGHDPAAVLKAARLVLPEDPYQELADQLGVPAGLPNG